MWTYRPRAGYGRTKWQNALAAAGLLLITVAVFAAGSLRGPAAPSTPAG